MLYELTYILTPLLEKIDLDAAVARIRGFIIELGGQLKSELPPAKQKLAYPIKKQITGYYATLEFDLEQNKLPELEKKLKSENDIIRCLILKQEKPSAKPAKPRTTKPKIITPQVKTAPVKKERITIEELDKKLEEILKE